MPLLKVYNASAGAWVAVQGASQLSNLSDVSNVSPNTFDSLVFDGVAWSPSAVNTTLSSLTDTSTFPDTLNSYVLTWSGNTWIASAAPGAAGGEVNTGANLGAGANIFSSKSGVNIQLRGLSGLDGIEVSSLDANTTLISGSSISLSGLSDTSSFTDVIDSYVLTWSGNTWIASANAGGGSGETNTASNLGDGAGTFSSKSSSDLQFRSLSGVDGVEVSALNANYIYISASGVPLSGMPDTTIGSTPSQGEVLAWNAATEKWIVSAVTWVDTNDDTDTSTLSSLGDVSSFPDVLTGQALAWNGTTWVASAVTWTDTNDDTDTSTLSSLGDVSSFPDVLTGQALAWNGTTWVASAVTWTDTNDDTDTSTLSALGDTSSFPDVGDGDLLTWSGTTWIASANIGGGGGEANLATNLGDGAGAFSSKDSVTLQFRSLSGIDGIDVSALNANYIYISASGVPLSGMPDTTIDSTPNQGEVVAWNAATEKWVVSAVTWVDTDNDTDTSTLSALGDTSSFPDILTGQALAWNGSTWVASAVTWVDTNTGEVNTAANLGDGAGVFSLKSGVQLRFRSVTGVDGIEVSALNSNEIFISASSVPLSGMPDTTIGSTPAEGEVLAWNAATEKWIVSALTWTDTNDDTDTSTLSALGDTTIGVTPSAGTYLKWNGSEWVNDLNTFGLSWIFDEGGSALSTGVKGYIEVPFDCSVLGWSLLGDQSGSIVVDIWKDIFANYPPTNADTITNGNEPTVSTATNAKDVDLGDWTTQGINRGEILGFNIDSNTSFTLVTLSLSGIKL